MKKQLKDADHRIKANLDHFIDQSGYPVRVDKEEAKLIKKYLKFLKVQKCKDSDDKYYDFVGKKRRLRNYSVCLTTKGIPNKVLAVYWKFRHGELNERYEELYNKIKDLSETY